MPTLLYLHGFLSSPLSYKAQQMQRWLQLQHPEITYICPQLSPYPDQCAQILRDSVDTANGPIYLVGSSMGGFWATYLAEQYNIPAVLINPAVAVTRLMPQYLNQPLKNYHSNDTYYLKVDDLTALSRYDSAFVKRVNNYWLLVQTGDETLDYQLATQKYSACRQTVEMGGDHSFQSFERFHQPAIDFFESFYCA